MYGLDLPFLASIGGAAEAGGVASLKVAPLDVAITIIYILGIVGLGLFAGRIMRKKGEKGEGDSRDYFLAGGTLRWPVIGLALFATNISCVHLVSLAQSGFDTGLLNGNFEWMAALTLIFLSLWFAPFYIKSRVATLPDFLERRYNRTCRDLLAIFSLVSAVTIHIGFSFLTGGIVIESLFGINFYVGIIIIASLTALYTIVGGLLAVVLTEAIQTVILVVGAMIITAFAWTKMGGWGPMMEILSEQGATDKVSMLRPHGDESGMPWYAILLGYPVLGIWYWCADQTIVQRVLGAKDENHARVGPLFAGLIKILPVFIFVLPGLLAFTLFHSGQLDLSTITDPTTGEVNSKGIYAVMITELLPTGLIGIMIAALLAALMSTVSGALNSISTLVAFDMFKRFKPEVEDKQLVTIGRIAAGVAMVLAICLVPALKMAPSIFNALNDIIAHIAPPVTCVFVLGVFWKKAHALAAQWTLIIGGLTGVLVFTLNKIDVAAKVADIPALHSLFTGLAAIPFMMMAFYLLCFCVVLQVSLTLGIKAELSDEAKTLCWNSPMEPLRAKGWPGIGDYRVLSAILLISMAILYYIFR